MAQQRNARQNNSVTQTQRFITIRGAREHNLKNINLKLPKEKLICITGISGSGKSSLAFDTIYAEGERRYVESLSAYARQFLGRLDKPDVDFIDGLSPAVSIDQKAVSRNPRSTVATVTEIYDYLRLLFARIGKPHCPQCGREIARQTPEQIVDQILSMPEGTRINVLAPIVRGRKGFYSQVFEDVRKQGFVRVRVDGQIRDVNEEISLDRYKQHWIEVVVDRLVIRAGLRSRLADSVETALKVGQGMVIVNRADGGESIGGIGGIGRIGGSGQSGGIGGIGGDGESGRPELQESSSLPFNGDTLFSEHFACPECGVSLEDIQPRMFSFNSPYGACRECDGLGTKAEFDPNLVIADPRLSIAQGAILPWRSYTSNYKREILKSIANAYGFSIHTPVKDLTAHQLHVILYGSDRPVRVTYHNRYGRLKTLQTYFEGVINSLQQGYDEGDDEWREELRRYMSYRPCQKCKGARLKPESLSVTILAPFPLRMDYAPPYLNRDSSLQVNIAQVCQLSVADGVRFFEQLPELLNERQMTIARQILKEIRSRLQFMVNVGLEYLTLDREVSTLANGEAQRIRLATQIGSGLTGVLYILDEPSIGLHPRDNKRLLDTLKQLRDIGNTVIVVEHDEETIRTADFIVDLGPGAGEHGGYVVTTGTVEDIVNSPQSITGKYLSGELKIPVPKQRRKPGKQWLVVKGAKHHNLKNIDVRIPLGLFVCITGVSGSGKSTLLNDILYNRLAHRLHNAVTRWGEHDEIVGVEHIDKVINIDQSPIGRTPRSNPATYTGVFTPIRQLFAQVREAKAKGYQQGRFSFNVKGGRCESCQGDGIVKIEMHWLPDVYVPCEVCRGKRYNRETLEVTYKGKNIADVLDMSVEEALNFFENIPPIRRILQTLYDVGMGYCKLGQPATTLSGGEAQRIKLAEELSRKSTGRTLYILDEPDIGLHFYDVEKLLNVLHRLVDGGNTVCVITHNVEIIKTSDWVIDLGPEGGEKGGYIVAEAPPEEIAANPRSYTGQFLRKVLNSGRRIPH